jgi:hypothetical protein
MADSAWHPYNNGETIGQKGSESGVILLDEEHELGARISLERATEVAPFAITCGIYGAMMHTCYLGDEAKARADYEGMKSALTALLELADDQSDEGRTAFYDGMEELVRRYA